MAALLQYGKLCKGCRPGKCVECPSEYDPMEIECTDCAGKGCKSCQEGFIRLTRCPQLEITPDVIELLDYAGMYEKGLPPVAGGALDQAKAFTDSCRTLWADQARLKLELGIF